MPTRRRISTGSANQLLFCKNKQKNNKIPENKQKTLLPLYAVFLHLTSPHQIQPQERSGFPNLPWIFSVSRFLLDHLTLLSPPCFLFMTELTQELPAPTIQVLLMYWKALTWQIAPLPRNRNTYFSLAFWFLPLVSSPPSTYLQHPEVLHTHIFLIAASNLSSFKTPLKSFKQTQRFKGTMFHQKNK